MKALSYSDVRQSLKQCMDEVFFDHEPLIVTRKNNENVVMISLNEYNALVETNYLLSSKKNAERTLTSLARARNGKAKEKKLVDQ